MSKQAKDVASRSLSDSPGDDGQVLSFPADADGSGNVFTADVTSTGSFDLRGIPGGKLARILHALPWPAMVVYRSGHIVFANKACAKLAADPSMLEGAMLYSILADSDGIRAARSMVGDVFSARKPQAGEALLKTSNGPLSVRMHVRSLRLGDHRSALVFLEDLTAVKPDRARSEAGLALRQEPEGGPGDTAVGSPAPELAARGGQAVFQTIVSAFDGFIFLCSADHTIEYANEKLVQRTGVNPVGRKCYEALHGLEKVCSSCEQDPVFDGQTVQRHMLSPLDNQWYNVFSTGIGNTDGSLSKLVIMHEITSLKEANEAMLQTERLKAVRELATTVAHKFNNLLQLIISGARLAMQNLRLENPDRVAERLQHIIATSKSGAETIKRLERFAGLGIDDSPGESTVLDVSDMVRQAIEMTKPWWKAKPERTGSKLRLRLKLKKGCLVRGRSNELFEAVVNLIKNAAEDLPQGGTIQISSAIQGDRVVLHVSDMSHEFDGNKPHRGPSATRNKPLNAKGIELVVTYGIVTRHGGTISTEPVNGAGTSFTVSLPLSKEPAPAARSAPDTSPSVNLRILLIDDFQPLVAMLGDGLAAYDHTISTALSGREGLAVLKENPIDLVICDLGMPDMNGWQVAREVLSFCAEERRAKIPFILLTGWAGQINVIDRIKECAVDRVLAKPVDVPQLLETIREVMSDAGHSCEPD